MLRRSWMVIEAGKQVHRLAHRELLGKPRLLQRDSQQLTQFTLVSLPRSPQDFHLTRSRLQQSFQNLDGGCLAGAVWPEQPEALSSADLEIETTHRLDFSVVGLLQIPASNRGVHKLHDTRPDRHKRLVPQRSRRPILDTTLYSRTALTHAATRTAWKRGIYREHTAGHSVATNTVDFSVE